MRRIYKIDDGLALTIEGKRRLRNAMRLSLILCRAHIEKEEVNLREATVHTIAKHTAGIVEAQEARRTLEEALCLLAED
jgi:hypothetical protein